MDINMENIVSAGDPDYNTVMFSWELIDMCQYNCSYCSAINFNVNKFKDQPHLKTAWKVFIRALSLKSMKASFTVEILGGEPTLHPDILNIVDKLCSNEKCLKVELITNLAKPLSFYQKFNKLGNNRLVIQPSYHPEYCDDKYIEKVIEINKWDHVCILPHINLSDDSRWWQKTRKVLDKFKTHDIDFHINLLFEVPDGPVGGWTPKYTDEFFVYFDDYLTSYGESHLKAPCRLNKFGNLTSDTYDTTDNLNLKSMHAKEGPVQYIDNKNNKTYLSDRQIIKHDLARFPGWRCTPLMYGVTMEGEIFNHCTNEPVPIYNMNNKGLFKCVQCPLERCDCDTKFQYYKEKINEY